MNESAAQRAMLLWRLEAHERQLAMLCARLGAYEHQLAENGRDLDRLLTYERKAKAIIRKLMFWKRWE